VSFVFTGPTEGEPQFLAAPAEYVLHGVGALSRVAECHRGVAVCLLPYRMNAFTEKINPLQLKESLASGKPVLSTQGERALRNADEESGRK